MNRIRSVRDIPFQMVRSDLRLSTASFDAVDANDSKRSASPYPDMHSAGLGFAFGSPRVMGSTWAMRIVLESTRPTRPPKAGKGKILNIPATTWTMADISTHKHRAKV